MAASAALTAAPASAKGLELEPSSDWKFREYDDRCRASRVFGEGEDRTTLWIEQGGVEPRFNLTLIGRPLRHPYGGGIRVQFGEEPEYIRSYIPAKSSKGRPVIRMYGAAITQPEIKREDDAASEGKNLARVQASLQRAKASEITSLRLRTSIVEPLTLNFGSFEAPMEFLADCGERISILLSEAGRPLSGEAKPPVPIGSDNWLTSSDYPAYLQRARMGGEITVRLTVNKSGKASSCFVVGSDKPQIFDDAVCLGLMKRAKFKPAEDIGGNPIASYYFYGVTFEMR
ncbi:MAG: energy transducer TonB [Pseudomonadota bacterium]